MALSSSILLLATSLVFLFFASPAHAFGAGNIASIAAIEGRNWRHGDIEDVLLALYMARVAGGQKFSKLDIQRVYFGNWLRDYSQAVDVGTVKYVSAEAIRILLWVVGFMTFGYGTGEFEVTTERLGCYQPTEHIDNPLGYAEGDDAQLYDRRFRGPVDSREVEIDQRTGLKQYIASEDVGINTSAAFVRSILGRCIELGRSYARSGDKADLYEALRLMGTGLHCLEDYAAHTNYTELSLIELGEQEVFPHVGRNTMMQIPGAGYPVYPIVTGTFGGVDFLHSVMGELSDHTAESELQSLEGAISESQQEQPSEGFLQGLLDKIGFGGFGGNNDNTGKMNEFKINAQAQQEHQEQEDVSPLKPEEWAKFLTDVQQQVYPVLAWHDNLIKQINKLIDNIPVLPDLIEQVQDQVTIFVYSVIAPYVLPIIHQAKTELATGSSEIIQSSKNEQFNIFDDDNCTDPTHSMLSKDHFSNLFNEPAGKVAAEVVRWAVPQIMECWDDESIDIDRIMTRIVYGVFHHPAQRGYGDDGISDMRQKMFSVVSDWWNEQGDDGRSDFRRKLSREGVRNGENHKPGVHDCGHGSGKPVKHRKEGGNDGGHEESGGFGENETNRISKLTEEAVGGGTLGGLVGGLFSQAGSSFLGGGTEDKGEEEKKEKYDDDDDLDDGGYGRQGGDISSGYGYERSYDSGYTRQEGDISSGYGYGQQQDSRYGREEGYPRAEYGYGGSSHGGYGQDREDYGHRRERSKSRSKSRSRSRSRRSDRDSRQHHSSHHGGGDYHKRHDSEEREHGYNSGDSDHHRRHRHHHHHHRKHSSDSD